MQGVIPASDKQIRASVLNIGPISNQIRSLKYVKQAAHGKSCPWMLLIK